MKLNPISLSLGLLVASGVCALATPAAARSMSGAGAVTLTSNFNPGCVSEAWGGAYNACGSTIPYMVFDVTIDNFSTNHTIWAEDFGAAEVGIGGYGPIEPFTCYAQAIAMQGGDNVVSSAPATFAYYSQQVQSFNVYVAGSATLRLVCENVPSGSGIASLNWTP